MDRLFLVEWLFHRILTHHLILQQETILPPTAIMEMGTLFILMRMVLRFRFQRDTSRRVKI